MQIEQMDINRECGRSAAQCYRLPIAGNATKVLFKKHLQLVHVLNAPLTRQLLLACKKETTQKNALFKPCSNYHSQKTPGYFFRIILVKKI